MAKNATLNAKAFKKDMKKLENYINGRFAQQVLDDFKDETPRDTGNAKSKTTKRVLKGRKIEIRTSYGYGDVLDDGLFPNPPKEGTGKTINGYSTQAPKGMSDPTIVKARKKLAKFVRTL